MRWPQFPQPFHFGWPSFGNLDASGPTKEDTDLTKNKLTIYDYLPPSELPQKARGFTAEARSALWGVTSPRNGPSFQSAHSRWRAPRQHPRGFRPSSSSLLVPAQPGQRYSHLGTVTRHLGHSATPASGFTASNLASNTDSGIGLVLLRRPSCWKFSSSLPLSVRGCVLCGRGRGRRGACAVPMSPWGPTCMRSGFLGTQRGPPDAACTSGQGRSGLSQPQGSEVTSSRSDTA